jgi:hypothetical protein
MELDMATVEERRYKESEEHEFDMFNTDRDFIKEHFACEFEEHEDKEYEYEFHTDKFEENEFEEYKEFDNMFHTDRDITSPGRMQSGGVQVIHTTVETVWRVPRRVGCEGAPTSAAELHRRTNQSSSHQLTVDQFTVVQLAVAKLTEVQLAVAQLTEAQIGDKILPNQWEDKILTAKWGDETITIIWGDKIMTDQWEDQALAYGWG